MPKADGARNFTQCDSLLIGDKCGAHTVPYIEARNRSAHVEHEATTSKISEDQLLYCRQRGLSQEDAERVFMPFFRADDARRQRIEGVGLGLTVTRSLVEIHQGKIWIVPAPPASGGSIHFTLPTARDALGT